MWNIFSRKILNLAYQLDTRVCFGPIKADIGFIACNTAHQFFDEFQKSVNFPLVNMISELEITKNQLVLCSPNAGELKLFGNVCYPSDKLSGKLKTIIASVNNELQLPDDFLKEAVRKIPGNQTLVFACTEISMQADKEGLLGIDTLKILIKKIVKEL